MPRQRIERSWAPRLLSFLLVRRCSNNGNSDTSPRHGTLRPVSRPHSPPQTVSPQSPDTSSDTCQRHVTTRHVTTYVQSPPHSPGHSHAPPHTTSHRATDRTRTSYLVPRVPRPSAPVSLRTPRSAAPPPSLTSPGPLPAAASCLHVHHHTLGLRAARRLQQHRAPLPQLGLAEGVVGPRGVSAGGRWQGVNEMDRGCEWSVGVGGEV